MDISAGRLTSLLREAMTPQALPSPEADPAKTALVKALVQPPLPSLRPQSIASALPALLPEPALVRAQQVTSAQIVHAYQALAEPNELVDDAGATAAAARRPTADGDDAQRGPAMPSARVDDGVAVRSTAQPWLALLSSQAPPLRKTSATNAMAEQGPAASRSPGGAQPQDKQMNPGFMSLAIGLLAATIVGLVLLALQ